MSVSNYERLLRCFIKDNDAALRRAAWTSRDTRRTSTAARSPPSSNAPPDSGSPLDSSGTLQQRFEHTVAGLDALEVALTSPEAMSGSR